MASLGEKALELIRESVRAHDMLGPFNEDKVRNVLEEIRTLYNEVLDQHCVFGARYLFIRLSNVLERTRNVD